jgi:hypothetical protein
MIALRDESTSPFMSGFFEEVKRWPNSSWAGAVSGWPKSDWYHLKLVRTSFTPSIVHVRFMVLSGGLTRQR